MKTLCRAASLALLISLSTGACSGSKGAFLSPSPSPASSPTGGTSPTPTVITPGAYEYRNAGVLVDVRFEGSGGTMKVQNDSGVELPTPHLYVLLAKTGKRVDGSITGATPVAAGATADLRFKFPPQVSAKTVGLLFLVTGDENVGAFAPA